MSMTGLFPTVSGPPIPEIRYRAALDSLRERMMAIPLNDTAKIVLDIPAVVLAVGSTMTTIEGFRAEIAQKLPAFDLANLDELDVMRLALAQSHTEYLLASSPSANLPVLGEELTRVRDILLTDFRAAAKRGLVSDAKLGELSGNTGYKNAAVDILAVCNHFRANWSVLEGKTGTSLDELTRAEDLAQQMMGLVEEQLRNAANAGPALDLRNRAFTLFIRAYEEVRRSIVYLRWHEGDADRIAPSAYAGRNKGRKSAGKEDDEAPRAGSGEDGEEGQATQPGQNGQTSQEGAFSPAANSQSIAGLPGSDPTG